MNNNHGKQPDNNKMLILIVGKKTYQVSRKYATTVIELGKKVNENSNTIIALEKDGIVLLKKDKYGDKEAMLNVVKNYQSDNYKVTYVVK